MKHKYIEFQSINQVDLAKQLHIATGDTKELIVILTYNQYKKLSKTHPYKTICGLEYRVLEKRTLKKEYVKLVLAIKIKIFLTKARILGYTEEELENKFNELFENKGE